LDQINDNGKLRNSQVHILLVDDEDYLVKLWTRVIERQGYIVTSFTSGIQAREAFISRPHYFDMLITDQSMPGITGYELAAEFLKIRNDMKIILCSGYLGDLDLSDVARKKGIYILLKPFDSYSLLDAIKRNLIVSESI